MKEIYTSHHMWQLFERLVGHLIIFFNASPKNTFFFHNNLHNSAKMDPSFEQIWLYISGDCLHLYISQFFYCCRSFLLDMAIVSNATHDRKHADTALETYVTITLTGSILFYKIRQYLFKFFNWILTISVFRYYYHVFQIAVLWSVDYSADTTECVCSTSWRGI